MDSASLLLVGSSDSLLFCKGDAGAGAALARRGKPHALIGLLKALNTSVLYWATDRDAHTLMGVGAALQEDCGSCDLT